MNWQRFQVIIEPNHVHVALWDHLLVVAVFVVKCKTLTQEWLLVLFDALVGAGCSIPVRLVVWLRMVLSDALVGAAFYVKVRRTWGRLVIILVARELAGCSIPVWFAVTGRVSAWVALTGASVRDLVREVSGTL